jgi:chromosome segregation ATPase
MKIEELHKEVIEVGKILAVLSAQVSFLDTTVRGLTETANTRSQEFADFRARFEGELASLKAALDELRRWAEKNSVSDLKSQFEVLKEKVVKLEAAFEKIGTRAWSVVPNVAGAIVNVLLAALVAFVVTKYGK